MGQYHTLFQEMSLGDREYFLGKNSLSSILGFWFKSNII